MNTQLIFEIVKGHEQVTPNTFGTGEKARTVMQQDLYMYNGDLYPVKTVHSFDNAHEQLPVGKYYISPKSFRVNQYGSLELDRYNTVYLPLPTSHDKQ